MLPVRVRPREFLQIPIYQVDAFTSQRFCGNPAAVCPLTDWIDDELMQSIAAENNLSETAFFVGSDASYELRWFTPTTEVDLCGHATLAGGHVLLEELGAPDALTFETRSGPLRVERWERGLRMDFPALPAEPVDRPAGLDQALGAEAIEVLRAASGTHMAVLASEARVRDLAPDLAALEQMGLDVVVTAVGECCDCVSRYFAPTYGVPEDPVTGSVHCHLLPYWAQRLGKAKIAARQLSARGGELDCELRDERVLIGGRCALYMRGSIEV